MKSKQIVIQVLIVLFLTSNFSYADDQYLNGDVKARIKRAKELIQLIINGGEEYNSSKYWNSVGELFINASNMELMQYKKHPNLSISLHAAWEQMKRTSFSRTLYYNNNGYLLVEVPTLEMGRFIGFSEKSTNTQLPEWWIDSLKKTFRIAEPPAKPTVGNKYDPYMRWHIGGTFKSKVDIINKNRDQRLKCMLLALGNFDIKYYSDPDRTIPYKGFLIESDEYSSLIPEKYLNEVLSEGKSLEIIGFTAWMNDEYCVFAFHSRYSTKFPLRCIDRKTSKLIWSTDCEGQYRGSYSGPPRLDYFIEIRSHEGKLVMFETQVGQLFLETFSLKDGKRLEQFRTDYSYENDDLEEETDK